MMKHEFLTLAKIEEIDNEIYADIETVYMHHPAIVCKTGIAEIYTNFGMTVINDMLPRAKKIQELENEKMVKEQEIVRIKEQIFELTREFSRRS